MSKRPVTFFIVKINPLYLVWSLPNAHLREETRDVIKHDFDDIDTNLPFLRGLW
jgi:hypothetical protein